MAKVPTLIFSLVAVFSFLIWGRAEDTSAALRRAQALEKAGQSRESIPIYLDVLHSDPECLEMWAWDGATLPSVNTPKRLQASKRRFSFDPVTQRC
jgi:hypothetical protein